VIESAAASGPRESARVTPSGLQIADGLTFDAWAGMGRKLAGLSSAVSWCLGDWLIYGEQAYGERYKAAIATTSLDYQTLRNYAWVARRFTVSRRRDTVSFQHHAEVASLPEPDQDLWLSRAQRSRWSRNELRKRVQGERRRSRQIAAEGPVRLEVQVTRDREQRWRDAATVADQGLSDWMADAADAAADALLVAGRPEGPSGAEPA
jgi:hypothetical protein